MVIFKFNFLALIVSEISWGPIFTLGGPARFARHLAENFCTRSEYFTTSNCVVNFNFLAPVVSESQIYINGPCAPRTPPSGNIFDTPPNTCFLLAYTYIAYTYIRISNGAIFNDLERPLTQISRSRKYLTLNMTLTVQNRHNVYADNGYQVRISALLIGVILNNFERAGVTCKLFS